MILAVEFIIVQWKIYRNTPYRMGKSMVSGVDFPLKKQSIESLVAVPIHIITSQLNFGTYQR
jgi:hypothetical protein